MAWAFSSDERKALGAVLGRTAEARATIDDLERQVRQVRRQRQVRAQVARDIPAIPKREARERAKRIAESVAACRTMLEPLAGPVRNVRGKGDYVDLFLALALKTQRCDLPGCLAALDAVSAALTGAQRMYALPLADRPTRTRSGSHTKQQPVSRVTACR